MQHDFSLLQKDREARNATGRPAKGSGELQQGREPCKRVRGSCKTSLAPCMKSRTGAKEPVGLAKEPVEPAEGPAPASSNRGARKAKKVNWLLGIGYWERQGPQAPHLFH